MRWFFWTPKNIGLVARNSVFGVFDKVRYKPDCSATDMNEKFEISLVESLDTILSNKRITKALIRLRGCEGWPAPWLFANPEDRYSHVEAHIIRKNITIYAFKVHVSGPV